MDKTFDWSKIGKNKFHKINHTFDSVTTNELVVQNCNPSKFIWLVKRSCLGHNKTKQAKNLTMTMIWHADDISLMLTLEVLSIHLVFELWIANMRYMVIAVLKVGSKQNLLPSQTSCRCKQPISFTSSIVPLSPFCSVISTILKIGVFVREQHSFIIYHSMIFMIVNHYFFYFRNWGLWSVSNIKKPQSFGPRPAINSTACINYIF